MKIGNLLDGDTIGPFGLRIDPRSLNVQLVVGFVLVAGLIALAIGLPALWLINRQFERQAWAQLGQGLRASEALYVARQSEVQGFSSLTAQRPTLRSLLRAQDVDALPEYLSTLQQAADLNLIAICSPGGGVVAATDESLAPQACSVEEGSAYLAFQAPGGTSILLVAQSEITGEEVELGRVLVGRRLDDGFVQRLETETGLDQSVYLGDQLVASSFQPESRSGPSASDVQGGAFEEGGISGYQFRIAATPYYASRFSLQGQGLEAEVALDISAMTRTRQALIWSFALSILVIAFVGSFLGARLARRLSSSLTKLTEAAENFRQGDLESPVEVKGDVRELMLVANALEGAREDLRQTLSQLRREKAWSEDLVGAIVEGIMTLDDRRMITFFSPGAERITGWEGREVLGSHCDEVFQLVERNESFSEAIDARPQTMRLTVRLRSGETATLAFTEAELAPSGAGDAERVLVFRDVSEEETLHRLLGNFLANIAHEFRTPLSALAASAELLIDQAGELSAGELQELLGSLYIGALRLQTLVDNLLESASMEAGHFRVYPRPADLAEIIGEATQWIQPLLAKREQRLVLDLPSGLPVVYVDPRRAIQVMVNLLSNANKYSPDGSQILVVVEPLDGWVRVSVSDQGPGIPPENRNIIFRRFSHLDREEGGTQVGAGLGLSVVKTIVEALGGEVGVEGGDGAGAVFWMTLPVHRES
jgi:PAS domain S-box-containing protein